jgi:hypothetical protein
MAPAFDLLNLIKMTGILSAKTALAVNQHASKAGLFKETRKK